jgi:beta-glucanase (GH16 family)
LGRICIGRVAATPAAALYRLDPITYITTMPSLGRRLLPTLVLPVTLCASGCTHTQPRAAAPASPKPNDDYRLVWADEFNTDGPLNPKDWNYEHGFVRNHELQWYQPDNATCKGGLLIIEGRRERKPNPDYVPGSSDWRTSRKFIDYTAASVTTAGKHAFQYGRFEIRARIDTRPGSWPAFWTLGVAGPWPACGEVDVMEYYDNTLLANIAWAGAGGTGDAGSSWNTGRTPLAQLGPGWSDQFHVWRMDWDPASIKLYCDGRLLNSQNLAATTNDPARPDAAHAPSNPFHQPAYILLNQALGGTRGGDPSRTPIPIRYEIDYVRVYQKTPVAAPPPHAKSPPPAAR